MSSRDGWPPQGSNRGNEEASRPGNGYRSSTPTQQQPILPPPNSSYYQSSAPGGPSLPGLSSMDQRSPPSLPPPRPAGEGQPPAPVQMQHQGYPLPTMQPAPGQPMPAQSGYDRDREMMEAREREARDREQRDRSLREQDMREQQQREQRTPHQSHAEPPQLHQPVAVGPSRSAMHAPNGILNNNGMSAGNTGPQPASLFGGQYDRAPPAGMQPGQVPIQNMLPFGANPQGVAPGQQPILNDALSYLDQVKVQFSGEPNVYNQFLDIMKDFKSQAIDTPGVIRRVSQLFQGNPNLIQGFNTFLPPGYRIECGTADDPNAIRVTTPMGTTVSPMGTALQPPPERRPDMEGAAMDYEQGGRDGNYLQHGPVLSPANRGQGLAGYGQTGSRLSPFDPSRRGQESGVNAALLAHQQEQHGVSQLQNAVSAAAGEPLPRQPGMSPMPESGTPVNGSLGLQQGAAGLEKRGPVEFNHAISYVNKIKNRFSNQPEIYKQFLEILQTYQRESKPIQDVYQQVTHLFQGAQDLLEDFKQFLPESAAHARAQAAKQAAEDATQMSNLREGPYGPHAHPTPRPDRMPPMGNFTTTPSANRDAKRKRGDRHALDGGRSADYGAFSRNGFVPNKRAKQQHQLPQQQTSGKAVVQAEPPPVSPTLVPALPEPMPPTTTTAATPEELAFFDKVKKFIGPRSAMNEFLKLCNLYSQDLINRNLLVKRAEAYIGSNPELFTWFKNFVQYDGQDQIIENRARAAIVGRVNLNNCRSLGQSYRQMPKRERNKVCSGRDELCRSVLNDEWVSHPTWASEDSGFIAHRKNVHEEGLHRIEEERHDYDLHIASIERTIQILEPLAQQAHILDEESKKQMTLPPDFGGQTQAIHKKVIAKVYGRERALEIMDELIRSPARVIPVLLARFRIITEQWKASQREWDKVWRDQTQRMFWRSLDHQGVSVKASDKRQFQSKTLYQEILVKYEEQKKSRQQGVKNLSKDQLGGLVSDKDVLHDAARLLLIYAEQNHSSDFPRLIPFIKEFIPLFFGMDVSSFQARITADFRESINEDAEDEDAAMSEDSASTGTRGRKANGRKADMRKDVLRSRSTRANKDDATSDSRGTTPEPSAGLVDEEMKDDEVEQVEEEEAVVPESWTRLASQSSALKKKTPRPDEPYKRSHFSLYGNTQIYCFFRLLVILYDRLLNLKNTEKDVHETVKRSKHPKPAMELGMSDKLPDVFFTDVSDNANYYRQVLQLLEQFLRGEGNIDMAYIEDTLRRYYLRSGWMLYTFDKLMGSLVRAGIALLGNDNKDRSWDILQLFYKDRKKVTTTHQDELQYRKQVEKFVKEGDLFKIVYDQATSMTTIRILRRDDLSFEADEEAMKTPEDRWRAYVSSYVNLDPTEGVPQENLRRGFLQRNLDKVHIKAEAAATAATAGTDESTELRTAELSRFDQMRSHEGLALRISVEEYRIYFDHDEQNTEWWMADPIARAIKSKPAGSKNAEGEGEQRGENGEGDAETAEAKNTDGEGEHQAADRGSEFDEKFIMNSAWMKGMRKDEVDAKNAEFREWRDGTGSSGAVDNAAVESSTA